MEQQPIRPRGEVNNHIRDLWKVSGDMPLGTKRSFLYPTLRWGEPAYTFFASPFAPRPNGKSRQGPPETWAALSAINLQYLIYARIDIYSFAPGRQWDSVQTASGGDSLEEHRRKLSQIDELLDSISPRFLGAQYRNSEECVILANLLREKVPEAVLEQAQCLAPDFFEWLYSAEATARSSEFESG